MFIINKQQFDTEFANSLSGDCLSLGSPHLSYMSKMSGYKVDNKPLTLYDTIIGDYSEKTAHPNQNQKLKGYLCYLREGVSNLKDNGTFHAIVPKGFIHKLTEIERGAFTQKGKVSASKIEIHKNHLKVSLTKPSNDLTEIVWENGDSIHLNLFNFNSPILSEYNEEVYNLLNNLDIDSLPEVKSVRSTVSVIRQCNSLNWDMETVGRIPTLNLATKKLSQCISGIPLQSLDELSDDEKKKPVGSLLVKFSSKQELNHWKHKFNTDKEFIRHLFLFSHNEYFGGRMIDIRMMFAL